MKLAKLTVSFACHSTLTDCTCAVEMLHDSALYKFMIDIDIDRSNLV